MSLIFSIIHYDTLNYLSGIGSPKNVGGFLCCCLLHASFASSKLDILGGTLGVAF